MSILEIAHEKDSNGVLYCMVKCNHCSRVYQITHSRAKQSKKHFCDKKCYSKFQVEDWQRKKTK